MPEQNPLAAFSEAQAACRDIISKYDEDRAWDTLQARDVPSEIVEFVLDRMEEGWNPRNIRRQLGIQNSLDKRWAKIMAAVRGGTRIDVSGLYRKYVARNEMVAGRLEKLIEKATSELGRIETAKEARSILEDIGKQVAQATDAMSRLQQATIKMGTDLGLFGREVAKGTGGGSGGPTIIVKTNIQLPAQEKVDAHHRSQRDIVVKARAVKE